MEKPAPKELMLGSLVAFFVQFFAIWPSRNVYLLLQDEGNILAWASRMLQGQLPYDDFFMRFMPGTSFGLSLVFRLAGEQISVARLYFMISLGLLCSAIWVVSRYILPRNWSILPPLFFVCVGGQMFPLAVYHWDAGIPALLALVVLAFGKRPELHILAGVLGGITVLYLQPRGVAVCLALGVMVLLRNSSRLKNLALLVAGAAIPGILFVGWLSWHGIFGKFWSQAILFNLQSYADVQGHPFDWGLSYRQLQSVWNGFGSLGKIDTGSWLLWLSESLPFALVDLFKYTGFFPILVLATLYFGFGCRSEKGEMRYSLLLGLLVLLWVSAYFALARATRYHFNFLTVAWYPISVFLLHRLSLRYSKTANALVLIITTTFVFHGIHNTASWANYRYPIQFSRGVLYSDHPQLGQITQELSAVLTDQFEGQDLFAFPELPLLVWLSGAHNPTEFERLVPLYYSPELLDRAEQQIRSSDRCGVLFASVADSIRREYPQIDADRFAKEEAALLKRLTKGAEPVTKLGTYLLYRFPGEVRVDSLRN